MPKKVPSIGTVELKLATTPSAAPLFPPGYKLRLTCKLLQGFSTGRESDNSRELEKDSLRSSKCIVNCRYGELNRMCPLLLAFIQGVMPPARLPMTATEVVDRMVQADNQRLAAFPGYTGTRRYHFENKKLNKRAEMTVHVVCDQTGAKTFEVVAESGSGFVRTRIIRRMIDAEQEASQKGEHQQTRIIPQNYDFQLLGTEISDGRPAYVLEISPKTKNQFLVRGRIWVDAEDFAITRVEGSPAKNPSFWIRKVQILHRYQRIGRFWLPVTNQSHAEARIFGANEVGIDYFDYQVSEQHSKASSVPETNMDACWPVKSEPGHVMKELTRECEERGI